MAKGGSSGGSTTTSPWGPQKDYLKNIFQQAQDLYNAPGPDLYSGSWTAPYTPTETAAQRAALDYAGSFAPSIANQTANTFNYVTGTAIDPTTNPYLAKTADAAVQPLYDKLTTETLPSIGAGSFGSHLYGSNRQGIAEGLAARGTAEAAGQVTSNIYNQAYQSAQDNATRALALAPTVQSTGLTGPETAAGVGAAQRAYDQALLDQAVQAYQYNQNLPYEKLAAYQSLIAGGYGGTSTTDTSGASTSPWMSALGGALSGAATGSLIPGAGPWGPAGGAALGGLIGLFG